MGGSASDGRRRVPLDACCKTPGDFQAAQGCHASGAELGFRCAVSWLLTDGHGLRLDGAFGGANNRHSNTGYSTGRKREESEEGQGFQGFFALKKICLGNACLEQLF